MQNTKKMRPVARECPSNAGSQTLLPRGAPVLKFMNHALLPNTQNANLPVKYEAAKLAIMECFRTDECQDWADKMQALASYARQSQDYEMEKTALRIRSRAIKRGGEILKETEKAQPGPKQLRDAADPQLGRKAAAEDAGLSARQAKTMIRVSNVPNEIFEQQVESENPPTITSLAQQGTTPSKKPPMFEQLGMTKEAFQAGMYFRGDIEDFGKAIKKYDIQDIVDGSTPDQRHRIYNLIRQIDAFTDQLISKL
jgi:hypothetical protein